MATMVGIGQMVISANPDDVLVAPNLGSCLGVAIFDPVKRIGGVIHCMLPVSKSNPDKSQENPALYVDTGVVKLLNDILALGCAKKNLVITAVGCSNISDTNNVFEIGKKNHTVFRKIMWKNSLLVKAEHVGDSISRTLTLYIANGESWLKTNGETIQLA